MWKWANQIDNKPTLFNEEKMDVDTTFEIIGEFGPYQKRTYFLLCLMPFMTSFHTLLSSFILATPEHRCALLDWSNDTFEIQNEVHQECVNRTIPLSPYSTSIYSKCQMYGPNDEVIACERWVYDKSVFSTTFSIEHNLVCGDALKTSHASMIFFGGLLFGSLGFGTLSDMVGRKKTMYLSIWLMLTTSIALAWASTFWLFCVLRFIIGMCVAGLYVVPFVLGMELVGPSKRVWAGIVVAYFFAFGLVILAGLGYYIRHWMYLELAVSVPVVFFISYWWIIPESPRWYISRGKFKDAEKIIRQIANGNKKTITDKTLVALTNETPETGRVWHLFSNRIFLVRTSVILINWMVVSMGYYGLSLNTGNLSGDFYLNFFLSGLAEFPAYTICVIFLDKTGRKPLHVLCMVLGGVACISTIFTTIYLDEELQPITVTLAMLGKVGISAAYAIIYVWSAELYPTVIRNAGMGLSSTFANMGGMISPYIADINVEGILGRALPLVIFGVCSVLAGLLALLLPETLNHHLPETIEDGKHFKKKTYYPHKSCSSRQSHGDIIASEAETTQLHCA